MASNKPAYLHGPKFTANERDVLDAIGNALKRRRIDFFTGSELGDMVKAGRLNAVLKALKYQTDKPNYGNNILETPNPERFPPLWVVVARRGCEASGLIQALEARETL